MRNEFYQQKVEMTLDEFLALHDAFKQLEGVKRILSTKSSYAAVDAIKELLGMEEDDD